MQIFEHHAIFDEITYDREELKEWFESVRQYRKDFGSVLNRFRKERNPTNLSHTKEFQAGLFDTIDTAGEIGKHVKDFDPVKKLVQRFNFDVPLTGPDVDVLIYKPGYVFHPHVDFHMHCGIMFPIYPDEGASPIDFYQLPEGETWERAKGYSQAIKLERDLLYSYHYSLKHPSMFNGDTIHGVRNNEKERVFLRLKCLSMTFNDVIKRASEGKFINAPVV